jgi:hypothetical protein
LPNLVGIWKTVRNVGVGEPETAKITGWRSGVERELTMVEYHRNRVRYAAVEERGLARITAIVLVTVVALLSGAAFFLIRRWGRP